MPLPVYRRLGCSGHRHTFSVSVQQSTEILTATARARAAACQGPVRPDGLQLSELYGAAQAHKLGGLAAHPRRRGLSTGLELKSSTQTLAFRCSCISVKCSPQKLRWGHARTERAQLLGVGTTGAVNTHSYVCMSIRV